jgi:tetratricopeptide (TPR) repeat protein
VFAGRLGEAASGLATANDAIASSSFGAHVVPFILFVEGQLLLTQGDYAQSATRFNDARGQAESQQEPLLASEALLGLARSRLARGELEAAATTFAETRRQFQLVESVNGDGAALLGTAQVLVGQEAWEEAISRCEAALTRFNQSDDLVGQADAMLALGIAHRGNGELDEASANLELALIFYQQQQQPLGSADVRYERAGVLLDRGKLEAAMDELNKAIVLVEQVMGTLSTPQQWTIFLRQYADLYALAAITGVRRRQDEQARTILTSFVRIAGASGIVQRIKAYEDSIPTANGGITEDEIRANKDLVKRLGQLRKELR